MKDNWKVNGFKGLLKDKDGDYHVVQKGKEGVRAMIMHAHGEDDKVQVVVWASNGMECTIKLNVRDARLVAEAIRRSLP